MKRALVLLAALGACASRPAPAADAGDAWADAWALATSWKLADSEAAAKRLAADLRPAPAAEAPAEATPVTPRPPREASAPPPVAPEQPALPAPRPLPPSPPPAAASALPPCNAWKRCNDLSLPPRGVPAMQRPGRSPTAQGGPIVGGVYDLIDVSFYSGFLSGLLGPARPTPRGFAKRSAILFPPLGDATQLIAQEVTERQGCADSDTLSLNVAGGSLTASVICSSSPCHGDCGGTLGYTARGGPSPTVQLMYARGEVDTFTLRPASPTLLPPAQPPR